MRGITHSALAALAGIFSTACGGSAGICDAAQLESALASAAPGDVVEVGACRIEGRFVVGDGVTLRGQGAESVLARDGNVVVVEGDGAILESLRIEPGAAHGIVAVGVGSLTVRSVELHATLGRAAIGLEDVTTATLEDVILTGPVTVENAIMVPSTAGEADTALFGVVLVDVGTATLTRVSIAGFGAGGLAALRSGLVWTDGTVSENLGLGLWLSGGTADLDSLTIERTLRGFRGEPIYGIAAGGGAEVVTNDVTVRDTEGGFGILHEGGSGVHTGLHASGHAAGGVIAQRTSALTLMGAELSDNDFGGLIAVEASGLVIDASTITTTHSVVRMMSDWGMVEIGDGVQLVRPAVGTMIRSTTVTANERAGVLVDLAGADTSAITFDGLTVDAPVDAFACVAQNGTRTAGWDTGVTRTGPGAVSDATFAGGLDVVEIFGPSDLPAPDALGGIIGPSD